MTRSFLLLLWNSRYFLSSSPLCCYLGVTGRLLPLRVGFAGCIIVYSIEISIAGADLTGNEVRLGSESTTPIGSTER